MNDPLALNELERDPILPSMTRQQSCLVGYLLVPILIGIMTVALRRLQETIWIMEHADVSPVFWYAFPVLVVALIGGRGPGVLALILSEIAVFTAFQGYSHNEHGHELALIIRGAGLPFIGAAVIVGMEALRNNTYLLIASEAAQARTRAIMGSAPVGIAIVNPAGSVLFANAQFDDIWGPGVAQNSIELFRNFVTATETGEYIAYDGTPFGRVLSGRVISDQREVIVELPASEAVWIDQRATMVRDQRGRQLGTLLISSNISERKLAELSALRASQREAVIARIGVAIRNAEAPESIQQSAASALCVALGVDRCCFAHYDPTNDSINIVPDYTKAGVKSAAGSYVVEDPTALEPLTIGAASPITIDNVHNLDGMPGISSLASILGLSSLVIATIGEELTDRSVLIAGNASPRQWTTDEISLVEVVAGQVRHATISAVLRLRDHKIATILQEALRPNLPESIPGLDIAYHYESALDEAVVGGDFVDIFRTDPGPNSTRWAIVIGDVAGKGLTAASQVATVRTMLRYALTRGESMASVIAHLSDTLASREWIVGFATMFIAIFNSETMELEYVSCGHESGFLRRGADGTIDDLAATGAAVGAFVGAVYESKRVTMSPGDMLFLYTDGVTDVGKDRSSLLGPEGVKAMLLSCETCLETSEIIQAIRNGVESFSEGHLRDDVCMLALKAVGEKVDILSDKSSVETVDSVDAALRETATVA